MLSNLSWKPNLFLEARIDVERLPTKRNLQVSYIYETQVVDCHLGTACYCLSTIQNCRRYKNKDATKLLEDKHAFLACGVWMEYKGKREGMLFSLVLLKILSFISSLVAKSPSTIIPAPVSKIASSSKSSPVSSEYAYLHKPKSNQFSWRPIF